MVKAFLDYLKYELVRSPRTVGDYKLSLKLFEQYFNSQDQGLTWETVDGDIIRDWMASMIERGVKPITVNGYLSAVKAIYRYALSHHYVEKDPAYRITPLKTPKQLPHFLKEQEMDRLLDDVEWGDGFDDKRARAIIATLYETGIRASELMGLDDGDVDLNCHLLKVTGKGNKQRSVPFGEELEKTLQGYAAIRDLTVEREDDAFFVNNKGRRIHYTLLWHIVRNHLALVSTQKRLSPHVLRHTYATAMLNHGAGIEAIRKLLGHESASTTEIYTHTTFEQLKRVYNEAHPRA